MVDNRLPAPGFINPPTTSFAGVTGYVSADSPTAIFKSSVLFNKNSSSPVLKSNLEFYNISSNLSSPENNWYLNEDILPDLRVRTIISFNPQATKILDFLSQRFNEYQAGKMSFRGNDKASILYESLMGAVDNSFVSNNEDDELFSLELFDSIMGSGGPYDTINVTRTIKNGPNPILNYSQVDDSVMDGVMIHDVPLKNFLLHDDNNEVIKKKLNSLPWQVGRLTNQDNYTAEIVSSKGFEIDLASLGIETFLDQAFSVYCYCYSDYQSFVERYDSNISANPPIDTSALRNGMGFVDIKTFSGTRTKYIPQVGDIVAGPTISATTENPDARMFSDIRQDQNITPDNLRDKLQDTFYRTMVGAIGGERTISQTIKNQNHFSDLWICKDQEENTRYSYAFDLASYLSENSPFPFLYISNGTSSELLRGGDFIEFGEISKVISKTMKKRRVEKNSLVAINDLSVQTSKTYYDDRLGFEKNIGEAMEVRNIFLSEGITDYIKIYEGVYFNRTEKKTQADIDCQYGVNVTVHDSSLLYLTRVQTAMMSLEKAVRNVYDSIVYSPPGAGIYSQKTQMLETSLSSIAVGETNAEEVVTGAIEFYVSILDNFGVIRSDALNIARTNMETRILAGDTDGIKNVADLILTFSNELNSLLRSYYPNNTGVDGSVKESKIETSRSSKNILLRTEHYFKETSDYGKHYGSGYSYLTSNVPNSINSLQGLSRISKQAHLSRASTEFSKYFNIAGSNNPNALTEGFADSSISYYSPLKISVYGKQPVDQTSYKIDEENALDFDFNRYAELFVDLLKLNKKQTPFQFLQNNSVNDTFETSLGKQTQDLFTMLSCEVVPSIDLQFAELDPANIRDDVLTVIDRGAKKESSTDVGTTVLGGGDDASTASGGVTSAKETISALEKSLIDSDFENLKKDDERNNVSAQQKKMPTKIMFNILGELFVNSGMNETNSLDYNSIEFNSLSNLASILGVSSQNIQDILEGSVASSLPNQLKSMIVVATMNEGLSFGNGFDAVRPKLKDKVEISGNNYISAVFNEGEYPPYERTGDPMKAYAKMLAFWMNYKQLACVEYLAGFSSVNSNSVSKYYIQKNEDDSYYYKAKRPVWRKFTRAFYESNIDKKFLCRLRPIGDLDLSPTDNFVDKFSANSFVDKSDVFDLPIYNRYFLLNGETGD